MYINCTQITLKLVVRGYLHSYYNVGFQFLGLSLPQIPSDSLPLNSAK